MYTDYIDDIFDGIMDGLIYLDRIVVKLSSSAIFSHKDHFRLPIYRSPFIEAAEKPPTTALAF